MICQHWRLNLSIDTLCLDGKRDDAAANPGH